MHANYPHHPGYLMGCDACEFGPCQCEPGSAQCVSLVHEEASQDEAVNICPACGERIDYCQGHGEMGDPHGAHILATHNEGDHSLCHPDAMATGACES